MTDRKYPKKAIKKENKSIREDVVDQRQKLLHEINNLKNLLAKPSTDELNENSQRALKEIILSDIMAIEDQLKELE